MEWISVNDKWPPLDREILAYGKATCGTCGNVDTGLMLTVAEFNGGSYTTDTFAFGEFTCGIDINYWCEIPKLPKVS